MERLRRTVAVCKRRLRSSSTDPGQPPPQFENVATKGQRVADDDTLHRSVKNDDNYLEYDHTFGRWVPTKRSFQRDDDGLSMYSGRVLGTHDLSSSDVARSEADVVFAIGMRALSDGGLSAEHDPVDPVVRRVDPAHCLVYGSAQRQMSKAERDYVRESAVLSAGTLPPAPPRTV